MKLRHDDGEIEIELASGDGPRRCVVNGRETSVEARYLDADTLLLDVDGVRHTVHLARRQGERLVALGGEIHHFAPAGEAGHQVAALVEPEVRAPMPGKVLQVLVAEGASVETGDGLLLLEAMKMENRLTAAAKGTVAEVRVAAGDMVSAGQVLLVLRFA